jgi:AcrR family transcriptional regulator
MAKNEISKEDLIRAEILAAARSLFQRYGLFKTTMEDIARALNKGKSTLYYYYRNKDEIFEAVISNEIRDVFREIRSSVGNSRTAEEQLRIYFMTAIKSIQKRILLYQIMKGEIGENLKTIVNLKYKMDNDEVRFIREILAFGVRNGEWVAGIESDLDLIAYSIVSALRGITLDLVVEERFPHWDERIGVLSEVFLRGLKR